MRTEKDTEDVEDPTLPKMTEHPHDRSKKGTYTLTRTRNFSCDDEPPRENTVVLWGDPDDQAPLAASIAVLPA